MDAVYGKPGDIEAQSFAIITELLAEKQAETQNGKCIEPENEHVVKRCIHTSADFDYADNLYFSPGAVTEIGRALQEGACIVTDTMMARSGINKKASARFGVDILCFMADEDVAEEAGRRGVTRAVAAMEKAIALDGPVIFAVGNAPTALLRLHAAMQEGFVPAGIIAVPVGFVNVVESKELILNISEPDVPRIVARGRKGGSGIAAAICNAILYDHGGRD